MRVPVLIVGAGPTGLVAANLLGLYGVQCLLVERNLAVNEFPRAISLDDEGLRILQALGLEHELLEHMVLDLGAEYRSRGRLLVRVQPTSRRNGYPLISTFDQPRLEATLAHGLRRFPCVEARFGEVLEDFKETEQGIVAHVRTCDGRLQQITCAYLLACDGGKSAIRHALNIPLRGTTFAQRWLVVDGLCEEQTPLRHITFFCDPARPAVSVPAPGQGWRWEFMLSKDEEDRGEMREEVGLRELLRQIGESREPQILRQSVYTFHASCASAFTRGRVFLLGDAAHLLPPFGGQGMNCGLRDAHNLIWKLALVLRERARIDLLQTYEQERIPHVAQMIRFSAFLGSVVMPTGRLRAFLRDSAVRTLLLFKPLAPLLEEMRIKPDSFYKRGFLLSNRRDRLAGKLLPQPLVLEQSGQSILLDELLGLDFALLRLSTNPEEAFNPLQAELWRKLAVRFLCILPSGEHLPETTDSVSCILDQEGAFARFMRGRRDLFLLVRPDRYIYGAFRREDEQRFVKKLHRHFCAR